MSLEQFFEDPDDSEAADRKDDDDGAAFIRTYIKDIISQKGKGAGEYTQSLNTAIAELHEDHPEVIDAVYEFKFFGLREGRWLLPRNISNRTPKAVPEVLIDRHANAGHKQLWTPKTAGIESAEDWKSIVLPFYQANTFGFDQGLQPEFKRAILLPNAASPIARHNFLMFGIGITGREGPQRVLDVGCSINTTLKGVALAESEDFSDLEVINLANKERNKYAPDERKTLAARKLLKEHGIQLEEGVGLDIFDWQSPELARHAWNNTFYLEELSDQDLIDQFNRVVTADPPNVKFQQVDVTIDYSSPLARDIVARRQKPYGPGLSEPHFDELFDVVCLRTVLYQLDERERIIALNNAHKWVKPDGMIVVQDFINFGRGNRTTFIPQSEWPGNYKTWIKDLRDAEPKFINYFNSDSGRARRVILNQEMGRLALAEKYGLMP